MRKSPPGHVFQDADGNYHHLGRSRCCKFGNQKKGALLSLPVASIRDGSIEAGLIALHAYLAEQPRGTTLTRAEIAYVCGCSDTAILHIEDRALKRIRNFHLPALLEHGEVPQRKHALA